MLGRLLFGRRAQEEKNEIQAPAAPIVQVQAQPQVPALISGDDFIQAAKNGDRETVRSYIDQHRNEPWMFDVQYSSGEERTTALIESAINGHELIVDDLLNAGANIEATASNGSNALHYSAQNNRIVIMLKLFAKGADVNRQNTQNDKNYTALHFATMKRGNKEAIQLLLQQGANPLVRCHHGENSRTAYELALLNAFTEEANILKAAEVGYTSKLKQVQLLEKLQENPQKVINEAIQLQNNGDFETLWKLAEHLYNYTTNTSVSEKCPAEIDQILQCYESIIKDSPYYKSSRSRLAQFMYTTHYEEKRGLEDNQLELKTRFQFACEGEEVDVMTQTFHELCERPGWPEIKITGEVPQLYILLAEMTKRIDKQDEIIAQLQSENEVLKKKVQTLENTNDALPAGNIREPTPRLSQSPNAFMPAVPAANVSHNDANDDVLNNIPFEDWEEENTSIQSHYKNL